MNKTGRLISLAIVVVAFAASATPAFALFTGIKAEGTGEVGSTTFHGGGVTLECGASGQRYVVHNKLDTVVENPGAQVTEFMPSQACTATVAGVKNAAELVKCEPQIGYETSKTGNGSIRSECEFTISKAACTIKLPTKENAALKFSEYTNSGSNLIAFVSLKGQVTDTISAGCKVLGVTATKAGTFELSKLLFEGLKVS